jgi:hypothetical protein
MAMTDADRRWGSGHTRQPEEETQNMWGAQELVPLDEWLAAEAANPTDLKRIAEQLDLPVTVALWRARAEQENTSVHLVGSVLLNAAALELLQKPVNGKGGHQSFVRSLQREIEGSRLNLCRKDFNRIREYLVSIGGGFRKIYESIMECAEISISKSGSIHKFFKEVAQPKN